MSSINLENQAKKHYECAHIPEYVTLVYADTHSRSGKPKWMLRISRVANEDDLLENHYFEELGDIVWQVSMEVLCCPYCGVRLADVKGLRAVSIMGREGIFPMPNGVQRSYERSSLQNTYL